MSKSLPSVEDEFIERLGLAIEAEGMPRIAGRILGVLLLNNGPFRAAELVEALQVSHGSISTNTRLLEGLGILERVSFPSDRNSYFQLNADPYQSLLSASIGRIRKVHTLIGDARRRLPPTRDDAHQRLAKMERFYQLMHESMESVLERLAADNGSGPDAM